MYVFWYAGMDQNFHDVTIVDMGDVPESSVSIPELSSLRQQWPPAVLSVAPAGTRGDAC